MTRILLPALAVCWVAICVGAFRARRHDGRRAPQRWHHAVATLQGWAPSDDMPVAATWCRPVVRPVLVREDVQAGLPRQRETAAAVGRLDRVG